MKNEALEFYQELMMRAYPMYSIPEIIRQVQKHYPYKWSGATRAESSTASTANRSEVAGDSAPLRPDDSK